MWNLTVAAGWNQTLDDVRGYFERANVLGVFDDDGLVASGGCIRYPGGQAWIGMILTLPEYRGRGFATRIMERLVSVADVPSIGLDATDFGAPLYERLDFVAERPVARWFRAADGPISEDRSSSTRPGRLARHLGPCHVRGITELAERFVSEPCIWDLFPDNADVVALATRLGFAPLRQLTRMWRGPAVPASPEMVALPGFEYGVGATRHC